MASCPTKVEIELPETPTYRVAAAFAGFILISLAVEEGIHLIHRYLKRRKLVALVHVLQKIKDELMILGFISICLVVFGKPVASICVPITTSWITCPRKPPPPYGTYPSKVSVSLLDDGLGRNTAESAAAPVSVSAASGQGGVYSSNVFYAGATKGCPAGMESMISEYGLKELDMFIFCLAMFHIVMCLLACGVVYFKVRQFRAWEEDHRAEIKQQGAAAAGQSSRGSNIQEASVGEPARKSARKTPRLTRSVTMKTAHFSNRIKFLTDYKLLRETDTPLTSNPNAHKWLYHHALPNHPPPVSEELTPAPEFSDVEAPSSAPSAARRTRSSDARSLVRRGDSQMRTREVTWQGYVVVTVACSINQFFRPVTKEEYLTVRQVFIESKGLPASFDFFSYIKRITMAQFTKVVGTSWWLWMIAGMLLLFNFGCSQVLNALSILPIVLVVVIGSKMQKSLILLGLDYLGIDGFWRKRERRSKKEKETAGQETAGEEADEKSNQSGTARWMEPQYINYLFWFGRPQIIITAIHYVLFQCAYQISYAIWSLGTWGLNTCIFGNRTWIIVRVVLSLLAPFIAAYVTLPLFMLLSTMNAENSRYILPPKLTKGLKSWLASAKRRQHSLKHDDSDSDDESGDEHH